VDIENHQMRRMFGYEAPTQRQGTDGVWKFFHHFHPPVPRVGEPMLIEWNEDGECTLTSDAISVVEHAAPPKYETFED
jgi:hypothetical protein